ncbi:MAG: diadenylate cyclase CdaA [Desulfobacterales bacterium]|nr:diadenylate cyclase CdaA [Desulfobacterales bacterium]
MQLLAIINNLRFQDVLDIFFLSVVAYHLYLWFRGTKAFKALVGLFVLGIIFTVARTWGLFLTTWVFQIFWQVLVILLIILFQTEIRQALERVNPLRALGLRKNTKPGEWVEGFAQTAFTMAQRRMGALMIMERADRVEECITGGQQIEGEPSAELLMSIFQKESPLHDGAMVIRDGQITRVASYLPLSPDEGLPKEWGTRHRAAKGLSEVCDALVVVVSEERGEVSLARQGDLALVGSPEELSRQILEGMALLSPSTATRLERIRALFLNQWRAKASALVLVIIFWLLLAGQQNFEIAFAVPLEVRNLPAQMEILEPLNPRVRIRVRGLRKDASTLSEKNVQAGIDLSTATEGKKIFQVTREHVKLPIDSIYIVHIEPSQIPFLFQQKPQS